LIGTKQKDVRSARYRIRAQTPDLSDNFGFPKNILPAPDASTPRDIVVICESGFHAGRLL
jgi:hypothetical protein